MFGIFVSTCTPVGPDRLSNDTDFLTGVLHWRTMNDKRCPHCETIKLISEFFPRKERPGQYSAWCRDCLKGNNRRYRNSEKGQKRNSEYRKSQKRRESLSRYNVSEKRKAVQQRYYATGRPAEYNQKRKVTDPIYHKRKVAQMAAERARDSGKLIPKPCEMSADGNCHGRIEMHHDDYDSPLDVHWLCARHHHLLGKK